MGNDHAGGWPRGADRSGWDTVGMDRGGRADLTQDGVPLRLLLRGLLIAVVLAGIFGMHVLTADDGANGHGALPMTSTAAMAGGHEMVTTHEPDVAAAAEMTRVRVATSFFANSGSGMPHGSMAACVLFLAAAAALILILFRYRRLTLTIGPGSAARSALTGIRRRGPPGRYRPRVALCVIRI